MDQFDLIKELQEKSEQEQQDTSQPKITYQQYDIDILGGSVPVLVPLRECENFEDTLSTISTLTKEKLKDVLREHRGFIQHS